MLDTERKIIVLTERADEENASGLHTKQSRGKGRSSAVYIRGREEPPSWESVQEVWKSVCKTCPFYRLCNPEYIIEESRLFGVKYLIRRTGVAENDCVLNNTIIPPSEFRRTA